MGIWWFLLLKWEGPYFVKAQARDETGVVDRLWTAEEELSLSPPRATPTLTRNPTERRPMSMSRTRGSSE